LYGEAVDEVLARQTPTGGVAWYLTDRLGTVRDVAGSRGAEIDHIDYTAFGTATESAASKGDRFKFTGQQLDSETGLYQDGARYYDPANGRFISEDPIGFGGGDGNLYRYVGNGASNWTDPSGLDSEWGAWFGGLAAGAGQGILNTANGVTDIPVGLLNLPLIAYNGLAPSFGSGSYRYFKWDWSSGRVTPEDPTLHEASKLFGSLVTLPFAAAAKAVQFPLALQGSARVATILSNGQRIVVAVPGAVATAGVPVAGIAAVAGITTNAALCARNAAENASKIDRNAFRSEREAYWKAEAQNNPGKYSADDLARMKDGRAPIGPDGNPMELHHVDRTPEGGLTPMSRTDHRLGGNYKMNHP
jgi:RHS repeat-associated protein